MADTHTNGRTPPSTPPTPPGPPDTALYDELNAFVVNLGGSAMGWNDCGLSNAQVKELSANVGPKFLDLAKRWYSELKVKGSNPYAAITASHDGILALQPQLLAWAKGQEYDPESAQIKALKAQLAGAEADIKAGVPVAETNYAGIVARLKALGVATPDAPPEPPAKPPTPAKPEPPARPAAFTDADWKAAADLVFAEIGRMLFAFHATGAVDLANEINAKKPAPGGPGIG